MWANVNQDICIGCGLCASMADDVFRMNDESKAESYQPATPHNQDIVQDAINSCPVSAIAWE